MKWVLPILTVTLLTFSANAGVRCSKDYFGNLTCYGTGSDTGYRSSTTKDHFGNTTTRDNQGNTTRCSKDYFGNITCRN